MPWKLIPPREGKTTFYYVRGKYLGITLDDSTETSDRAAAGRVIATWRKQAERGEFKRKRSSDPVEATFLSAAVAYMQAGGERKYVKPILDKWGAKPLDEIDQIAIDTIAAELYPNEAPSTRNRQVHTPISAILKRAGIEKQFKRPKGWKGNKSTSWLEPEQAFALFAAADKIEPEFGLLCRFLLYTGLRLSEALSREVNHLKLDRSFIYLGDSKNGDPRGCHLPPVVVEAFQTMPPRKPRPDVVTAVKRGVKGFIKGGRGVGRPVEDAGVPFLKRDEGRKLFRYHKGGALYAMQREALKNAGLKFPRRQGGFHLFCHTYGSWMHRFGGLDAHGLTDTNRWTDPDSAWRYVHTTASTAAQKADLLPTPKRGQVVEIKVQA